MQFDRAEDGFTVLSLGGRLFTSADGLHYERGVDRLSSDRSYHGIHFPRRHAGWVVGDRGGLFRTRDGGHSWNLIEVPTKNALRAIRFSGSTGIIVGNAETILRSGDNGESWIQVRGFVEPGPPASQPTEESEPPPESQPAPLWGLHAVHPIGDGRWLASGSRSTALLSEDDGKTWSAIPLTLDPTRLFRIEAIGVQDALFLGAPQKLLRSNGSLLEWKEIKLPPKTNDLIRYLERAPDLAFLIADGPQLFVTSTQGEHWVSITDFETVDADLVEERSEAPTVLGLPIAGASIEGDADGYILSQSARTLIDGRSIVPAFRCVPPPASQPSSR